MADQSHYNQFSRDVVPWAQGLEQNQAEFFGVQAGMEMLRLPNKHQSSFNLMGGSPRGFVHRDLIDASNKNFLVSADHQMMRPWPIVDESSLQSPIDRSKERLALSLFNMKQSEVVTSQYQQQLFMPERRINYNSFNHSVEQPVFQLRNSKYLSAAQELLNEICSLDEAGNISRKKLSKTKLEEGDQPSSSASLNLHSMEFSELQKTKAQLLLMQDEVDKRARRYSDQMKAVVASFEAVVGEGAATVYMALASKAMSRHFRCLRDGITAQIRTIKKMMGENDAVAPGTTKGETPRLKILDQSIRQQKAFHHGIMEQHPWRPQRGLPERSVSILRAWLFEHFLNPYPNDVDKHILAKQAGLSRSQVSNWFINARVRLWKPMVEEMYMEEMKELESQQNDNPAQHEDMINNTTNPSQNKNPNNPTSDLSLDDQKPLAEHLLSNSDQSLFSIVNSGHHGDQDDGLDSSKGSLHQYHNFGISNYDIPYSNHGSCSNNAGRVSLTLGLQQHGGGGMNLSFSSNSNQSLLYSNEHQGVDHDQAVQFSILDGDSQNLPYRNLMEAQLLHDLAG